jgi:predicted CXXCH cytochrome family protein
MRGLVLFLSAIFIFILCNPVAGALKSEECLDCHEPLKGFQHGSATCISCHTGITSLPHDDKLPRPSCALCHSSAAQEYAKSVHDLGKMACNGCHKTHFISKEKKTCAVCHAAAKHASLPSREKHLAELACVGCHGRIDRGVLEVEIRLKAGAEIGRDKIDVDGNGRVDKTEWDNLEAVLSRMPKGSYDLAKQYVLKGSMHAISAQPAPCKTCHTERELLQTARLKISGKSTFEIPIEPDLFVPELPSMVKFKDTVHGKKGVQCINCHTSQRAIDDRVCIGCHEKVYTVYKDTIHAKKDATKCTDCHNPHAIKSYKELNSAERLAICSRCHKDYIAKHDWLPNTVLHFQHLECSACHSPQSEKSMVFNFGLKKGRSTTPVTAQDLAYLSTAGQTLRKLIDKNGDGTVSSPELTDFFVDLQRKYRDISLSSSIIITKVYHAYSEKSPRDRVCKSCHSQSAPFYSSMYLLLPEKDRSDYVPVKGTVLSEVPVSVFVDICLLGEEKIRPDDLRRLFSLDPEERSRFFRELGTKWIDLAGLALTVLILLGITAHIVGRVLTRR